MTPEKLRLCLCLPVCDCSARFRNPCPPHLLAGVTVVHMAGFDSIPADLGTFLLADTARSRLGLGVHKVEAFMSGSGTVSGGTIASGLNIGKNPAMAAMVPDPLLLFPASQVAAAGTGSATTLIKPTSDAPFPAYRPDFDSTTVPFVMAAINTRIVRRTAGLLAAHSAQLAGHPHMLAALPAGAAVRPSPYSLPASASASSSGTGDAADAPASETTSLRSRAGAKTSAASASDAAGAGAGSAAGAAGSSTTTLAYSPHLPFAYGETMLVPVHGRVVSYVAGLFTAMIMALVGAVLASPLLVRLVTPFVPKPGTGGSPAARARAWFHYDLIGATDDMKQTVTVRVSGGDGGYENTSEMLSEVGLLLCRERASLPCTAVGGGFLTPAVAFGRRLVEVLNENTGMQLEVLSVGQPAPAARLRETGRPVKAGATAAAASSSSAAAGGAGAASSGK